MKKKEIELPQFEPSCKFIDTHCHLDMELYTDDLDKILNRAKANSIVKIVTIGIDLSSSKNAVDLARRYPQIFATIGIHPHDVTNLATKDYNELSTLYSNHASHIVGYGEIGLDYVKLHSDPVEQRKHFAKQLEIAHELKLPVVIHNREANDDTIKILRKAKPLDFGGIMHCFSGDIDFAKKVLELGMLISIPGIVTFKNAKTLQVVAREVPLMSMVLETDGPFLAPHPFRGKRNEPSYLLFTAQKIAELREIDIKDLARQTTENAEKLFNFSRVPHTL